MTTSRQTLAEMGEYAFIQRIRDLMPGDGGPIIRSVGDDCLVTKALEGNLLFTVDTFVDTVHFNRDYSPWDRIGKRCMAASVSDIAAMAGKPAYSLVSLSLPSSMVFQDAVDLFRGMAETANRLGCPVAGGETTATPGPATITITVVGSTPEGQAVLRNGARPGDALYVTGHIGDAMAGLAAFVHGFSGFKRLKERFLEPEARVELAAVLRDTWPLSAMIDLSDGLATDCHNLCRESGCGIVIDAAALPLSDDLTRIAGKLDRDAVTFALTAGEDFELLFAAQGTSLPGSSSLLGHPVTRIGSITGESGTVKLRRSDGTLESIPPKGYEHFRQ